MSSLQTIGICVGITYLIGACWFLIFERRDGYFMWRIIATFFSPLAVPALLIVWFLLKIVDLFIRIKDGKSK